MLESLPFEVLQFIFLRVDASDLASLSLTSRTIHKLIENDNLLFKRHYLALFDEPVDSVTTSLDPAHDWRTEYPEKTTEASSASCSSVPTKDDVAAGKGPVASSQLMSDADSQLHAASPTSGPSSPNPYPWKDQLQKFVRLQKLLESESKEVRLLEYEYIAETVFELLKSTNAAPWAHKNVPFLARYFEQPINRDVLLCGSSMFEHAGNDEQSAFSLEEHRQLAAKLHCLYGVPVMGADGQSTPCQPFACSRVYDLRQYTTETMWGPFMDDGSQWVDWERMEAIMIDLNHNIQQFRERLSGHFPSIWTRPFEGATPHSFHDKRSRLEHEARLLQREHQARPLPRLPDPKKADGDSSVTRSPVELKDPYNVTGTWMRVVCFLDYTELFKFNFIDPTPPPSERRPPLQTQEAFRLIVMKIRALSIEPPGPDDGQALPVVHFNGRAQALSASWDPNAHSDLRGTVRLTPEGEVRWTVISVYGGEERWKGEGIQIGGLQSSRGVLGNWFDKDYDFQGPAGPTAFWKVSDDLEDERQGSRITIH